MLAFWLVNKVQFVELKIRPSHKIQAGRAESERSSSVAAVLSISGPTHRLPDSVLSRLIESVRTAARDVSRRLGYPTVSLKKGGKGSE